MNPTASRRSLVRSSSSRRVRSISPIQTCPDVAESSPARQCMNVDLPEPDGPMTAVNRSRSMTTSTASRATTLVSPSPYTLVREEVRAAEDTVAPAADVRGAGSMAIAASLSWGRGDAEDDLLPYRPARSSRVPSQRPIAAIALTPGVPVVAGAGFLVCHPARQLTRLPRDGRPGGLQPHPHPRPQPGGDVRLRPQRWVGGGAGEARPVRRRRAGGGRGTGGRDHQGPPDRHPAGDLPGLALPGGGRGSRSGLLLRRPGAGARRTQRHDL